MGTADTSARSTMRADARRNRERLLSAALAAFTEHGSDDTSLEEIARRAGVGIGTLYRHFPTRQALLEAVYRDQVEALCAQAGPLLAEPSAGAALTGWLRALTQFGLTKRTLSTELLAGPEGMDAPVFATCRNDLSSAATALLSRAQQAGAARPGLEPADLMRLTHAIVMASERAADPPAEADRMLGILLGGVFLAGAGPDGGQPDAAAAGVTGPADGSRTGY